MDVNVQHLINFNLLIVIVIVLVFQQVIAHRLLIIIIYVISNCGFVYICLVFILKSYLPSIILLSQINWITSKGN